MSVPDAISLDVARNLRAQSLEALHAALDDWRDAAGTGNYRWICARWVLRCIKDFRWHDAHAIAFGGRPSGIGGRRDDTASVTPGRGRCGETR